MNKKGLTIIVEKTGTGFSAYAKEMAGIATAADTIADLKVNISEVLLHQIEYMNEMGEKVSVEDFEVNFVIDLEQFFDYFAVINKSAFAEKYAGINQSLFRQYTKKLAPLSDERLAQISNGLHKLADELSGIKVA